MQYALEGLIRLTCNHIFWSWGKGFALPCLLRRSMEDFGQLVKREKGWNERKAVVWYGMGSIKDEEKPIKETSMH